MRGTRCRQLADQSRLSGLQPAQKLVQGAEHLSRELGRYRSLRVPAFLQECGQSAAIGVVEQAEAVEQQLQAAEHRPAGDRPQRSQRKCEVTRCLTARRIDQSQRMVGDQQTGEDACVAQQPLEALMRRRLPPLEGASRIRVDTRWLYANEELPSRPSFAQLGYRPCGL